MSYTSNDTITSPPDMLAPFSTFAQAAGWTQDEHDTGNYELHLHKGSMYFAIKAYTTTQAFKMRPCTGYSSGSAWNAQAGASPSDLTQEFQSGSPAANLFGANTRCHFFANTSPDFLAAVFVNSAGSCGFITATEVGKRGTWTGGQFYNIGSYWHPTRVTTFNTSYTYNGQLKVDLYSQTWLGYGVSGYYLGEVGLPAKTNAFSGLSPLLPAEISLYNSTNGYRVLGYFDHIRAIDFTNFDAGDEITVGSDTWMVFPMGYRAYGDNRAVAIRKVV